MFLHIENIEMLTAQYTVKIRFNNGTEYTLNLSNHLEGDIFNPLKDDAYFKKGYLNTLTGTIEWENGADFAPEFLFEIAIKKAHAAA